MRNMIICSLFLLLPFPVLGNSIFGIVPASTAPIVLAQSGGASSLSYTVTNNTNKSSINNITIDPSYGLPSNEVSVSVTGNTCAGALAVGATCTFSLAIQALSSSVGVSLSPRVCGFSGAICSTPVASNRVSVTSLNQRLFTYIASPPSVVYICPTNNDGTFGACTTTTCSGTVNIPVGANLNPANTILYVSNVGNSTVSICPVNSDGTLGTCTTSTGSATFSNPSQVVFNPLGTFAYVVNFANSSLSLCPVNSDGTFGVCTVSTANGSLASPEGGAVNPAGTLLYVCNAASNTVTRCPINSDGSLGVCTAATGSPVFSNPSGIAFNPSGTIAYITNNGGLTTAICPVNSDGSFGTCAASTAVSTPLGIDLNATGNFALISSGSSTVTDCPINSDGTFGTCTTTSGFTSAYRLTVGLIG